MGSNADVVNSPTREMTSAKWTTSGIQKERCVRVASLKFRAGPRKTLKEADNTVKPLSRSPSDFVDKVAVIPIIGEDIIYEDAHWDHSDKTSKNIRRAFTLQRVLVACLRHCLTVLSHV